MLVGTFRMSTTPDSIQSSGIFSWGRAAQKQRFLGELFPAQLPEGVTGKAFVDFFQVNRMSGEPKGILAIRLGRSRRK
jgi:hypothetical protein